MQRLMNASYIVHFGICSSLVVLLTLSFGLLKNGGTVRYIKEQTIDIKYDSGEVKVKAFWDSSSEDSIFLVKTSDNIPLHYFQKIKQEVCFEKKCRRLKIVVYWNITGRYLGFELTEGEFLSKYDHEPFSHSEYERLNDLLADQDLPLRQISFEELTGVPENNAQRVDAISGATSQTVAEMVVEGAAYTTHTLWNIVHGPTQDFISDQTESQLSADLIDLILHSKDVNDRLWTLERIDDIQLNNKLRTTILKTISDADFFLSYSAVGALGQSHLGVKSLQDSLFNLYKKVDHSVQRMIIEKLMEAPYVSSQVIIEARELLPGLNGAQLSDIFRLFTHHEVFNPQFTKAAAEILKNKNRYISKQAHKYLSSIPIKDKEVDAMLEDYDRR